MNQKISKPQSATHRKNVPGDMIRLRATVTHLDTLKRFSVYFSKLATLIEKISVSDFQTN
jgi:hypothetical protein